MLNPLPEGWSAPELVEDTIDVDGVDVRRAGLSTVGPDGEEVCGSAAGPAEPQSQRAWYELLERVSGHEAIRVPKADYSVLTWEGAVLDRWSRADVFPSTDPAEPWRHARSNGVALHVDWTAACERALWELAERDRVLRSWRGEIAPEEIAIDVAATPVGGTRSYDWKVCSFPEPARESFSYAIEVVGVFGLPRSTGLPFVLGLAGRPVRAEAVTAAASEALQMLSFLWGEPLPEEPAVGAPGPLQHLDAFQVPAAHARIRHWLAGGHQSYARSVPARAPSNGVGFIDLTPEWLPAPYRVAKAVCRGAEPLVFGRAPSTAHLPADLQLHPIP